MHQGLRNLVSAISAVVLSASAVSAQEEQRPGEELIVYTGTGIPTDFNDALVEPFGDYMEEKYGVRVQVRTVPGAVPSVWAKLQTEWPNPTGDVYWLYNQMIREGASKGYWIKLQDHFSAEEWASFDQDVMETMNTGGYSAPIEISA